MDLTDENIVVSSKKKFELINITSRVENVAEKEGVEEGLLVINITHATAGILINEDEKGLKSDFLTLFEDVKRWGKEKDLAHNKIDNNAQAHLLAGLIGSSKSIIIKEGRLNLGTWQKIFLVELDGPRSKRNINIRIIKI